MSINTSGEINGTTGGNLTVNFLSFLTGMAAQFHKGLTFTLTTGTFPVGASITSSGTLTVGTAVAVGNTNGLILTVTNGWGKSATIPLSFTVSSAGITLSNAYYDPYNIWVRWSGGVGTFQYVIITWQNGGTSGQVPIANGIYQAQNLTPNTRYTFIVTPYTSGNVAGQANTQTVSTDAVITSATYRPTESPGYYFIDIVGQYATLICETDTGMFTMYDYLNLEFYTPIAFVNDTTNIYINLYPYNVDSRQAPSVQAELRTTPLTMIQNVSYIPTTTHATISWQAVPDNPFSYVVIDGVTTYAPNLSTTIPIFASYIVTYDVTIRPYRGYPFGNVNGDAVTLNIRALPRMSNVQVVSPVTRTSLSLSATTYSGQAYVIFTWPGGTSGKVFAANPNWPENTTYLATGLSPNTSYTFTATPYHEFDIAGTAMTVTYVTPP